MKYTFKQFIPLISIFLVIIAVTLVVSLISPSPDQFLWMRVFMGSFFVVFGLFKVLKLKGFAKAYREYDVIAKQSTVYSYFYPFLELALGIAYFFAWQMEVVNWITLVVMLVSVLGVYLKLRKREPVMCACLGVVFKIPMTWVTLIEDLLMAAMALIMIII